MPLMDVEIGDGDILNGWHRDRPTLDVEITVGHVWMRFTGRVTYLATTELVLAHADGELSISLFCAGIRRIEPRDGSNADHWKTYRRVLQIATDGGAICTVSERRLVS
jgi:hypothetical protein